MQDKMDWFGLELCTKSKLTRVKNIGIILGLAAIGVGCGTLEADGMEDGVTPDSGVEELSVNVESGPADEDTSRSATFYFLANGAENISCQLDSAEWTACSSPIEYTELVDGTHEFIVRVSDELGNVIESDTYTWHLDATAPSTVIDS
jgi:hypothetical protein